MRIVTFLVLAFWTIGPVAGQIYKEEAVAVETSRQVADTPATFFGPFRINGDKPAGFETFDFFILSYQSEKDEEKNDRDSLVPDNDGRVAVRGELVTMKGTPMAFANVTLTEAGPVTIYYKGPRVSRIVRSHPVELSFATVEIKGIRYEFSGKYLDTAEEEGGGLTSLRGVLKKYRGGRLLAVANETSFRQLAYQELTSEASNPGYGTDDASVSSN